MTATVNWTRYALLFFLGASTAISVAILAVDNVLWEYAPSHAYGLVGLTSLDSISVVSLLFLKSRRLLLLAALLGATSLVILLANLFVGAQFGVMGFSQQDLTEYFLGYTTTHKGSVIAPTFGFYKISRYTYEILLAIQPFIAATGLLAYRRR